MASLLNFLSPESSQERLNSPEAPLVALYRRTVTPAAVYNVDRAVAQTFPHAETNAETALVSGRAAVETVSSEQTRADERGQQAIEMVLGPQLAVYEQAQATQSEPPVAAGETASAGELDADEIRARIAATYGAEGGAPDTLEGLVSPAESAAAQQVRTSYEQEQQYV